MTNYTQWKSLVDLHEYSAIPDSVMQDWTNDALENWLEEDIASSSIDDSNVWIGSESLLLSSSDSGQVYQTDETQIPGRLPVKGESFGVLTYLDGESGYLPVIGFGIDNIGEDQYRIEWGDRIDEVELSLFEGGSKTTLETAAYSGWRVGWYYTLTRWHDSDTSNTEDTIEVELYEMDSDDTITDLPTPVVTLDAVDDTHSEQTGFAQGANNASDSEDVWHDYPHIRGDADT